MSALSVRGLRKSYDGAEVVSGVDLAVAAGECFGLLGPNGAGKTTTLKLCLGLIEPDAGEIELLGEPVPRRAREARARVGVVPQLDNLDPDFSVVVLPAPLGPSRPKHSPAATARSRPLTTSAPS